MAFGLPVEGSRGPYVGETLLDVATCGPDERAAEVAERLGGTVAGPTRLAVLAGERVAIGAVTVADLRAAAAGATVEDVMEVVPDTLRPSVPLEKLDSRVAGRFVTTPDGELLGAVDPAVLPEHAH